MTLNITLRSLAGLVLASVQPVESHSALSEALSPPPALNDTHPEITIAGHRGCWRAAPENSLAALERCIAFGIDIVEVDLRVSADNQLVVFHDRTLRRMAGRDEAVADLTLEQLEAVQLRERDGRDGASLTSQTIPSFRNFVEAAHGRMTIILDMKDDPARVAPMAAQVLRELSACDSAYFALVASPAEVPQIAGPLLDCASYLPNLRGYMGSMSQAALSYQRLDPIAVAVRFDDWSYLENGAPTVLAADIRIWVNTLDEHHAAGLVDVDALIDPHQLWGRLIENGVTIIQTDEPEALAAYVAALGWNKRDD